MIDVVYRRLLRPLLFRLSPETAHHLGIWGLKILGLAAPWARRFFSVDDPTLRVTIGPGADALTFPNPIGLAAGFDKDAEAVRGLAALGFGFLEVGTVTPRPQPGNPKPRLFRFPAQRALVNRMGFNNAGAAAMARRLRRLGPSPIPLGINIGKNKDTPNDRAAGDYITCLETLFDYGDFFVVNVSSPNTPGLRDLQGPATLAPLLTALRRRCDELMKERARARRPLMFVKVSPDENPGEDLVEVVTAARFDGIVATNTTRDRAGLPPEAPTDGGASGALLTNRSVDIVRRLSQAARGRLTIIGVGGVFTAGDVRAHRDAGASLVEVYTGFIYGGPGLVRRLLGR
jgi:dihydroorotate dehydrogenase